MSDGALARMRPDLGIGAALPPAGQSREPRLVRCPRITLLLAGRRRHARSTRWVWCIPRTVEDGGLWR